MISFLTVYEITVPKEVNVRSYEPPDITAWHLVKKERTDGGDKIRVYVRNQGRHDLFYFARHCDLHDANQLAITTVISNPWIPDSPGRPVLLLTHRSGYATTIIAVDRRTHVTAEERQRRVLAAVAARISAQR